MDTAVPLDCRTAAACAANPVIFAQMSASTSSIKISFDSAKRVKVERVPSVEAGEAIPAVGISALIANLPLSQPSVSLSNSPGASQSISQKSVFESEFNASDAEKLMGSDCSQSPASFSSQKFDPAAENCSDVLLEQQKFIVFEQCLTDLFAICRVQGCGAPIDLVEKTIEGSAVTAKWRCVKLHSGKWCSQPKLKKQTKAGNILLPAAITVCGLTYARVAELFSLLNIPLISSTYYYENQKQYVYEAVKNAWEAERKFSLNLLQLSEEMDPQITHAFFADGQADSPGHCAEYLTYNVMSAAFGRVVGIQIVSAGEVDLKSTNMERLACQRAVDELLREGIAIGIFATDRHPQIIALLRKYVEDGKIGRHSFDPYHVIKGGVSKKISEAVKNGGMELLAEWKDSIVNHAWWSLSQSKGNAEFARDIWSSIIYHVVDEHQFQTETLKRCLHEPLDPFDCRKKNWMEKDSPEHQTLKEVLVIFIFDHLT